MCTAQRRQPGSYMSYVGQKKFHFRKKMGHSGDRKQNFFLVRPHNFFSFFLFFCIYQIVGHLGGPSSHSTDESLIVQLGPTTEGKGHSNVQGECLLVQHVVRGRSITPPGLNKEVKDWVLYVRCQPDDAQHPTAVRSAHRSELSTILALSAFELSLKTSHFWRCFGPESTQLLSPPATDQSPQLLSPPATDQSHGLTSSAVVRCWFDTNFKGPILVATDVGLYLFLRNLVQGYTERAAREYRLC